MTDYPLGSSPAETDRLILQSRLYSRITRRFLVDAGIAPGQHIVDLGCGAGDVAFLAADLVGPAGTVLALDRDPAILDTARRRAAALGFTNIRFAPAVLEELPDDAIPVDTDAVIGRWLLMYLRDPAALLRRLAARLGPGATLAFQEMDLSAPPAAHPPSPTLDRLAALMIPPPGAPGPNAFMGRDLCATYLAAGLPAPRLTLDAPLGAGADYPGYDYLLATLRTLLPALARAGATPPDVETLAAAVRREAQATPATTLRLPFLVGAWARVA